MPLIWNTVSSPQSKLFGNEWFQETLHRFRFTQQEWLPSTWLTNGLLDAARLTPVVVHRRDGVDLPVVKSVLYLALLISNALFLHVLTVWAAKRWFRTSYANFACRGARRRQVRLALVGSHRRRDAVSHFPRPLQLLLMKDWRLLRRDPVQWSQFLIFFGLLGLVLSQRRSLQQSAERHRLHHLDQHGELPEPGRSGADSCRRSRRGSSIR